MSSEWNETLYRVLLDTSFRAVIFAAIVALILSIARVRSSGLRHAAWTTVLLAMLLMPLLLYLIPSIPIAIPIPSAAIQPAPEAPIAVPATAAVLGGDPGPTQMPSIGRESLSVSNPGRKPIWPFAIMALYCIGSLILFGRVLLGWRTMTRIARSGKRVDLHPALRLQLIQTKVPVYESEIVATPMTVGIFSPRIILPVSWRTWPQEKLNAVLAHEFSHVRRRDTLIVPLAHLNCCLYWFHPLAWWLERTLASTAELACDDEAVRTIGGTRYYAEVLLDMARAVNHRGGRLALQGLGVNGNGFLGQRIDRLLRGNLFCEISRARKAMIALGCAAAVFLVVACREKPQTIAPRDDVKPAAQKALPKPSQSFWAKRLHIITAPVNAPLVFGFDTSVQGLEVDIGNEIAKSLGIGIKWFKAPNPGYRQNRLELVVDTVLGRSSSVPLSYYDYLFELLKKGGAEVLISAIAMDPGKCAEFEFSKPYYETGDIIARQRNRFDIADLASLSGKKVGVVAGRPGDAYMATQKTAVDAVIARYSTMDDALGALNRGELDAVVGDEPLVTYSCVKSFHNTIALPALINEYKYAAVVRRGKTELLATINATIDRLDSTGRLKKLDETWLGNVRRTADYLQQEELEAARLNARMSPVSASLR